MWIWDSRKEQQKVIQKLIIIEWWAKAKSQKGIKRRKRNFLFIWAFACVHIERLSWGRAIVQYYTVLNVGFYVNSIYTPYAHFHTYIQYRYTHSTNLSVYVWHASAHYMQNELTHAQICTLTSTFGETTSNADDMYAIRMKSERAQFSASALQCVMSERKRECMWREDCVR